MSAQPDLLEQAGEVAEPKVVFNTPHAYTLLRKRYEGNEWVLLRLCGITVLRRERVARENAA